MRLCGGRGAALCAAPWACLEQRLLEDHQLPLDAVGVLELDQHRPQPPRATVGIEGAARGAQRAADALLTHLEQHQLEKDLPLLLGGALRGLKQPARDVDPPLQLLQPRLREQHTKARVQCR